MPRRVIPFVPNTYYHLYNRGNNRQNVFFESDNYLYFLRGVEKYLRPAASVLAYCLMPTHYHMLVRVDAQQTSEVLETSPAQTSEVSPQTSEALETPPAQTSEVSETSEVSRRVSRAMQKLLISYTKAINKRFSRVGSLFQGQFQAKPIQKYSHLLNLCIYIHANPVKDGLVDSPEDWPYSNYLEWLGERDGTLVDPGFVREHFGSPAEYRSLVMDYVETRRLDEDTRLYLQSLEK
jgi:REP element-mobilizing transposase RayT